MTAEESGLPACERFTVLASRPDENLTRCDVCNHLESGHAAPGRRSLSGGEIETLRRNMLIATYEKFEASRRKSGNGEQGQSG